jgi:uncharacterized protein YutE (UPF0331/DUF86 family)
VDGSPDRRRELPPAAEHQVISTATAASLRRAVGFRNVVAHGYAGLDVAATFAASTAGLDDLDRVTWSLDIWVSSSTRTSG